MSGVSWTKDQEKVIHTHNRNLLVSAAAGSGKTAVLVQRIVEMITDPENPMDVDELLVVTFTNAAAAEMRERVANALAELLDEHPQDRHLKRQNTLIHQAQITTIDSFCLHIIRNYFNQLDIDPAFRIGDEGELKLLLADVMDEMLEEYYRREDEDFGEFVETYARGKSDSGIEEYIYQVHDFARSTPWPEEWFAECRREVALEADELSEMPWMKFLLEDVRRQADELALLIEEAKRICLEENGPEAYLAAFLDDEALVKAIQRAVSYRELSEVLERAGSLTRLKAIRSKDVDPEKKEEASAIRTQVKQVLTKMRKLYAGGSEEDVMASLKGCRKAVLTLLGLAEDFGKRYQAAKQEKNLVDFSDLEHFAIQILLKEENAEAEENAETEENAEAEENAETEENVEAEDVAEAERTETERTETERTEAETTEAKRTEAKRTEAKKIETETTETETENQGKPECSKHVEHERRMVPTEAARQLSSQYREILIDEYQDSNLVQETLLNSISRERDGHPNVFMVGDVKQSIYRFRLARPELFMQKYESYTKEDSMYQKIELHQNFRSRREVLESANQVFWKLMLKTIGGIVYTEDQALHVGASFEALPEGEQEDYRTELLLCDTSDVGKTVSLDDGMEGKTAEDREEFTSKEAEAHMIASKIRELTDEQTGMMVWDKKEKKYRRAKYQDIAVLCRSMAGWSEIFTNVFMNAEIPAVAETRTGYFNTIEVETMLSLLAVLDNPMQDIPLAAVMHSPIGDFSDTELAEIMAAYKKLAQKGENRGLYGAYAAALYGIAVDTEETLEEQFGRELRSETEEMDWEYDMAQADGNMETDAEATRIFPELSETLVEKLRKLEGMLNGFRKKASYLPIHELLYYIYEETGYYRYVLAMPAGQVRAANLDMLAEKASAYEATSYRGVFHFIRYIEKLKKYDTDFGEASLAGEEDNAVRMMSIHKSKGLEFPIVFLAGMGKKFNKLDLYGKVLIDPEMGIATDYLDLENRIRFATLKKQVLKRRLEVENLGEELRVLYVAMTRAKEKLIMTAALSGVEKRIEKWAGKNRSEMLFTTVAAADSYLDWILMSLPGDIRRIAMGLEEKIPFGWIDVKNITMQELVEGEVVQQAERKIRREELLHFDTEKEYDAVMRKHLENVMGFVYPHEADIHLHTKMAVSELKKMAYRMDVEEAEWLPSIPEFMKQKVMETDREAAGIREKSYHTKSQIASGAERGTMYHHVLELLPMEQLDWNMDLENQDPKLKETALVQWIMKEIETLFESGKISPEEKDIVEYHSLAHFFLSDLGKRMVKAAKKGCLYREKQFVMGVPAKEIPGLPQSEEYVVIQGIIDAWFVEDGEIVLVDYKTDRIRPGGERVLAERYQTQLDYYERALRQMTGMPVKEKWMYSFALEKQVGVPFKKEQNVDK